jgi:predicted ATP-grasp superfamily ATP-dependent carboligase
VSLQKLLVVGFSTRGLAEAVANCKRRDYALITLDYFGDYDQEQWGKTYSLQRHYDASCFSPQVLVSAASGLDYDAVAYSSSLENEPELVDKLSLNRELLGNDGNTLRRVRNWETFHRFLADKGFSYPKTLYHWQEAAPPGQWLLKGRKSGGGTNIYRVSGNTHLLPSYLLQEYCAGIPASVSFVANGCTARILGVSEQLCGCEDFGAPEFYYTGSISPLWLNNWAKFPPELWNWLNKIVLEVTAQFALKGLNGIDFLLPDQGEPLVLEVNPRYSASMELFAKAYGYDLFAFHVGACQGESPPLFPPPLLEGGRYFGKAIVYAPTDLIVGNTASWFQLGIRDIPHPGEEIPVGSPVCTVLAQGVSRDRCLEALRERQRWVLSQVVNACAKRDR